VDNSGGGGGAGGASGMENYEAFDAGTVAAKQSIPVYTVTADEADDQVRQGLGRVEKQPRTRRPLYYIGGGCAGGWLCA